MYDYFDVVKKRVISTYEATVLGKVDNILVDKAISRVRFFVVKRDDNSNLYFPFSAISSMNNDAIMLKNLNLAFERSDVAPPFYFAPIGVEVYSFSGKLLGKVDNVSFERGKVTHFTVGSVTFNPSKIVSISEDVIIVNDSDKKIRLYSPVKKVSKPKATSDSQVLDSVEKENVLEPTVPAKGNVLPSSSPTFEKDKTSGYAFLLGREAIKELMSASGEVIVKEGSVIDEETLLLAHKHDRLVQLALYSK